MTALRRELEKEIYDQLDIMDPSGKNTDRMKKFFGAMDDKAWYRHMDKYFDNPDQYISVGYEPYNHPVTLDFVYDVAKKLGVPVEEYVYKPFLTGDVEDPPGSVHKETVIDVPVKRLKQMANTKNHTSTSASRRDSRTGQVTGEDRTARITDVEGFSLLAGGMYSAAQEYYGPMADNLEAHNAMLRAIQRNGEVELRDLPNEPSDRVTLDTINSYMIASCLMSNLVSPDGYTLPSTIKGRDDTTSTIHRR